VLALASLMMPLVKLGDIRPYLAAGDNDINVIAAAARERRRAAATSAWNDDSAAAPAGPRAMIVGITDPEIVPVFDAFGAGLFVAPIASSTGVGGGAVDFEAAVFTGMRTKNAADFCLIKQANALAPVPQGGAKRQALRNKLGIGRQTSASYREYFDKWVEKGAAKTGIVARAESESLSPASILLKIKNMSARDRSVLGDKLLRDNLRELTAGFFKPSAVSSSGQSAEIDNMRARAMERAAVQAEKEKALGLSGAGAKTDSSGGDANNGGGGGVGIEGAKAVTAGVATAVGGVGGWFKDTMKWIPLNIPTIILWLCYSTVFFLGMWLGLPMILMVGGAFIVKIPEKAPKEFEYLLRSIFPLWLLYPTMKKRDEKKNGAAGGAGAVDAAAGGVGGGNILIAGTVNMSGVWTRKRSDNIEAFLGANGAGFAQRKLGGKMALVHTITMNGPELSATRLQEDGGPIHLDNTYTVRSVLCLSLLSFLLCAVF
jgi:hypothetical protein